MKMDYPIGAVAIVIRRKGDPNRYLVSKRLSDNQEGQYGAPGGKMDLGEDPLVTVGRECFEETGKKIKWARFMGLVSSEYFPEKGTHYICLWFEATLDEPVDWDFSVPHIERYPDGRPKNSPWEWLTIAELEESRVARFLLKGLKYSEADLASSNYSHVEHSSRCIKP